MIRNSSQVAFNRRIPRRRMLLAYLAYEKQPLMLYRELEPTYLRVTPTRYPRRRKVNWLLLLLPPIPIPIIVPNVVGLTQSAAVGAISSIGLTVSSITFVNSLTVPAGLVISQTPVAGTGLPVGGLVSIVLSLGPITGFRVMAVTAGEYGGEYYEPRDVFDIQFSHDYSDSTLNYESGGGEYAPGWMLRTAPNTPLYQTLSVQNSPYFPAVDPNRRFVL